MKKTTINLKQIYWINGIFSSNKNRKKTIKVIPIGIPENFSSLGMGSVLNKEEYGQPSKEKFFEVRNLRKFLGKHEDSKYHEVNAYTKGDGASGPNGSFQIPISFFKIVQGSIMYH